MGLIIVIRPKLLDSTSKHVSNSGIWISLHRGYVDTGSRAADYLKEKVKKHNAPLDVQCLTVRIYSNKRRPRISATFDKNGNKRCGPYIIKIRRR